MAFGIFNKKPSDVLTEKMAQLKDLCHQKEMALGVITGTISSLELMNQEIDDASTEIQSYCDGLKEIMDGLDKSRKENTALIANFSKLLTVE